jgi:hypothetical protein
VIFEGTKLFQFDKIRHNPDKKTLGTGFGYYQVGGIELNSKKKL